jgi:hypothetical protein
MYWLRTKNCPKTDLAKRWLLPDRVFFACGACQVLAYVFLKKHPVLKAQIFWIKPNAGHTGNHIFVLFNNIIFDYHGYSNKDVYLFHYWKRAKQRFPDWEASLVEIDMEALITEGPSKKYDGLWVRTPYQFYKNALPRAETFLMRFPSAYMYN